MPKNPVTDPITDQEMAIHPERLNPVPAAAGFTFDAVLDTSGPPGCPRSPKKAALRAGAEVKKRPNFIEFYTTSFPSYGFWPPTLFEISGVKQVSRSVLSPQSDSCAVFRLLISFIC
jgi:hypothetical protein